jgi:TolA-binding protein
MMKMEIQKLKKKLLREELTRRRKASKSYRWMVRGVLLCLIVLVAGLAYYLVRLDKMLEEQFVRAEQQLEKGEYQGAVDTFANLHRRHPNFHLAPQALYQSGEILNLYLGKYQEALLAYLLVEKDFPQSEVARKAQLKVAEIYKHRLRDYGRAIVAYQKLLDQGAEESDRLQYEVADAYFRISNFEQARIEFDTLVRMHPGSPLLPEAAYRLAVSASLEGALAEAERAFRVVASQWPESPFALEARFGLATVLEEREELLAALQILQDLAGLYPNSEILAKKTAQVQDRIQKKKKAI